MSSPIPQGPPLDPAFLAQSRIPEILFGTLFPFVFATVFVLGRFYSRAILIKTWGTDDWGILVSWVVGGIALTVINCLLTRYGSGKHIETLTLNDIVITIKLGFVARVLYQFTLLSTKLSICAFYYRVFTDRTSKRAIWLMAAAVTIFSIPLLLTLIFRCHPIEGAWSMTPSKCTSDIPPLYASAILNILADVTLLAFVIPKIASLHIPKKQKLGLIAILSLSILVILAAIIRVVRVLRVVSSQDVPWDSYDVDIWAAVEINAGIFCVSAPAVKPLLRQIAPGFLSSIGASDNYPTQTRKYGGGTAISRMTANHPGFELSSQTNLGFPPKNPNVGNKSWIDFETKASRESESVGDAESERAIVEKEVREGEIRKTVRVMVQGVKKDQDRVDGFECV
ncbi:hypothetical protein N431DRAFT_101027 [Stipitochalara longipes BDJ]|nr:hypothetical protein N431DRAFT_101027 [Stipitochalara longipes BDJ]